MKKEIFVEQPSIEVKIGIRVKKETSLKYSNDNVKQELDNLVLKTVCVEKGTNGINSYETKSYITVYLNEGDILLFDENRGYYMPRYPMSSIEDAIADVESLKNIKFNEEEQVE